MSRGDHVDCRRVRRDVRGGAIVAALAQQVPQLTDGVRAFANDDNNHESRTSTDSIGRLERPLAINRSLLGVREREAASQCNKKCMRMQSFCIAPGRWWKP